MFRMKTLAWVLGRNVPLSEGEWQERFGASKQDDRETRNHNPWFGANDDVNPASSQ